MTWFKSIIALRVLSLGIVHFCFAVPLFGLSFFLPQIVKDFGLTNVQAGLVTAIPYAIAMIGMVHWGSHSDRTRERKWHVVISFAAMSSGLAFAAITASPIVKMAFLCIASWGVFSYMPVFWALPTAFLSGAGAAAGIAAINSIASVGGYFGPSIFGQLRDWTGTDLAGLTFLSTCPIIGIVIVLVLGHNPLLERSAPRALAAE